VTRASVQLSIQYKKNSREKEDACLQLHVVFDVQFREVDCQNSLVSPERRISLQSKGGFRVDKARNFTHLAYMGPPYATMPTRIRV